MIAIDPQPVHLAAEQHLLLAHHRYVILRLTGDDARAAAGAGGQVDRHAPAYAAVADSGPGTSSAGMRRGGRLLADESGFAKILAERGSLWYSRQRAGANDVAVLQSMMRLRAGQQVAFARASIIASPVANHGLVGCSQREGVEADARCRFPPMRRPRRRHSPSERDGTIGMTRHDPHRCLDSAFSSSRSSTTRHVIAAVLAAMSVAPVDSKARASAGLIDRRIVPRQLRERLGQLLQPAVVGERAVVDRRIWREDDLAIGLRCADARCCALGLTGMMSLRRSRRNSFAGERGVSGTTPSCSAVCHQSSNSPDSCRPRLVASSRGRSRRRVGPRLCQQGDHLVQPCDPDRAAQSAAERSTPCRRKRGYRSTIPGNGPRASATGKAATFHRGTG